MNYTSYQHTTLFHHYTEYEHYFYRVPVDYFIYLYYSVLATHIDL